MKNKLTDEEIEREIERLKNSPDVKLARAEINKRYKNRKKLYMLRWYEKHGAELRKSGVTFESLRGEEA